MGLPMDECAGDEFAPPVADSGLPLEPLRLPDAVAAETAGADSVERRLSSEAFHPTGAE